MPQITWQTVFSPSWTHLGIDALTRGSISKVFDNFEDYADSTAVQAVWTETGGAGNPTIVTGASAIHGTQSMQTVVAGADGTIYRTLNQNIFDGPFPRRIRMISFKGSIGSGSDSISIRLSDASDATLYREWVVSPAVGTDGSLNHIIDLDPNNDASWVAPTEGATTWNPDLIDRFEFRGLANGSTFVLDDIIFYYEYSLMEQIGFGTEPATDDGADGSVQSKIRKLSLQVQQLVGTTEQYSKSQPHTVYLNNSYTFGLELKGIAEQGIPTTTEIVPGNYKIERVRNGTTTEIVASSAASESAGFIYATYTPLEDNWQPGDEIIVTFSGGSVYNDTDTSTLLTANAALGQAVITVANAALFQVGQQVRIYDDTPDTEWLTVLSIDSPTQITFSSNLVANYTTALNAAIILAEQTILETAHLIANVTFEPELSKDLLRWVLADYDDFDFADADGNNERWDVGYIANSDGSAAGAEGGTANINTTTAGQARVSVDPDATPTQSAYALKRDEPSYSRYFSAVVDADIALDATQVTATFAGLRISSGDTDDPNNYVLIAREATSAVNRITARAEFAGVVQSTVTAAIIDNALAFKIERYGNVWNVFYSLTQFPNQQWVKVTQFEDANGDMSSKTSIYLYTESGGTVDAQTAIADFDNWRYFIGSGAIDQLLSTSVLASGTFTTSSATVPADTGRTEGDNYWNGAILMPTTGVVAFQPRLIVDFANAGGVFTVPSSRPFSTAPGVGDEYVILAYQGVVSPDVNTTTDQTTWDVVGTKADIAVPLEADTASLLAYAKSSITRGSGVLMGVCDSGMSASTTIIVSDDLVGFGNDAFNTGYQMVVLFNTNSAGTAPEMEMRDITDYTSLTGSFTTETFSANVEAGDIVLIVQNNIASLISVYGIADAASDAGTIRDAARTEVNDWWNGQQILMLSGLARGQVRPIWDFVAATDDIEVSPDFDAVPAAGDVYAILTQYSEIVPRAIDDTQNRLTSQVIGRKDDTTVPTPGAASTLLGYAKALVARGMGVTQGTVTSEEAGLETTQFYSTNLIGFGNDFFNEEFSLQVIYTTDGAAPLGETRDITDYVTADGHFTVGSVFSAAVNTGDKIAILHKTQLLLIPTIDTSDPVDMTAEVPDNSVLAHVLTDDGDSSVYDRRRMSLEAISNALGIVNPGGTGFDGDGSGTTAYEAIVGVTEAVWMDGTAQQSLADMPFVQGILHANSSPRVNQDSQIVATLSLHNLRPDADVIQTTEYSGTTITIARYRKGVDTDWTNIIAAAAMTEAAGQATYSYTFTSASWAAGDLIRYTVQSCVVEIPAASGQIYTLPTVSGYGLAISSLASSNSLALPVFAEFWDTETIEADVWTITTPATGTLAIDATEAGHMKVGVSPNAAEVGRLVSDFRIRLASDQVGANSIIKKLIVEFEAKFTNVANIDNTLSFFGLSATTAATRTTNNIAAFTLTGDALYATTDDAATENDSAAGAPTLTNWNKFRIEAYSGNVDFYVNEVRTNNFTLNLPDQMMYLNFYIDTEGAAGTFDLGPIRYWYEDFV